MDNRAHQNPVFAHLTRNTRWPSARATLWLATGLMPASLALTVFLMTRVEQYPFVVIILWIASWGLHIAVPLVVAPVTTNLTVRETEDESFQLLRVTPGYSPEGAVRGLVLAALFRLRVPLVLMVALSPFVMVVHYRSEKAGANHTCYMFVSHEEWREYTYDHTQPCIEPSDRRLLLGSLVILLWLVGLWGVTLFSAALVVWLALWGGRADWVWVYIVGVPLCVAVVLTYMGPIIDFPSAGPMNPLITIEPWPPPELYVAVPFSVVFYVMAWGIMRLARRWA